LFLKNTLTPHPHPQIVIKENVFVYDKKYFKQILGGAMGSSFTLTLANK